MGGIWLTEQVATLAADSASERAGRGLATPRAFPSCGADAQVLWGLAAGSGKNPYQVVIDVSGSPATVGYKCSCPSRKFPCKHVLGLLFLWSAGQVPGSAEPVSGPVERAEFAEVWWVDRQAKKEKAVARAAVPMVDLATSGDSAAGEGATVGDPAAGVGADGKVSGPGRDSAGRDSRVAAGLGEFDQWLADQIRTGLAGTPSRGRAHFEKIAARMVDAQAPGVASRLRELPAVLASGDGWPGRLLEEYALLRLLIVGFQQTRDSKGTGVSENLKDGTDGAGTVEKLDRGGDMGKTSQTTGAALPAGITATIRSHVGYTVGQAQVLTEPPIRDRWTVMGIREALEGKVQSRRFWLRGGRTGRWALVLQFRAGSAGGWQGAAPSAALGGAMDADLHFYPSSAPLRALIGADHGSVAQVGSKSVAAMLDPGLPVESGPGPGNADSDPATSFGFDGNGITIREATGVFAGALARDPWLRAWPIVLRAVPLDAGGRWQLVDTDGVAVSFLLSGTDPWLMVAAAGGSPVDMCVEWTARGVIPLTIQSVDGPVRL